MIVLSQSRVARRALGRHLLAAAALCVFATPALAVVSSLNLTFNGSEGGFANTGFESAYNPDATGYLLNFNNNNMLGIQTLDGDIFGNYENDPDTAKNLFYSEFTVGDRTVVEAKVNALNLNQNFHGGGIWIGTDEDHYIRLGLINNSFEGGPALEALRENEDRWTADGLYPNRPGFDIESRYVGVSDHAVPSSGGASGALDVNNAIIRLVRDHHAVAGYISFDNGATFTRAGGTDYSFNALATDATSLPIDNRTTADPTNSDLTSHSVEGAFKVGVYAFGGGSSRAVIQFDTFKALTGTPTWTATGDGDWTSDANWSNGNGLGAPTNIESTAIFGQQAAGRTINVPSDIVATRVTLGSTNGYTISGTGLVRFDWFYFPTHSNYYTDGPGRVTVSAGNNTISAPTQIAHMHEFDVAAGASLTLTNLAPLTAGNNTDAGIRKLGTGMMNVNTLAVPNIDVQGGTLKISPNGTAAARSFISSLNVLTTAGSTAKLDISDNAVIVDYGATDPNPLNNLRAMAASGRGTGNWSGPGIISSNAAADSGRYAVAVVGSSELTAVPSFFGSSVDSTAVLLRYTYRGDSDVNGAVNFDDLLKLAKNYNGSAKDWATGDSDYDSDVDFDDLLALAKNYNATPLSASQSAQLSDDFRGDFALAQSLVPEPTTLLAAIGLLAATPMRRRR